MLQLRSVYVILKDHEQELCIILCLWSLLLLARQAQDTRLARQLLDRDYVKIGDGQVVLPEDARVYSRPLESLPTAEAEPLPAAPAHGGVQPLRRHAQRAGRRRSGARRMRLRSREHGHQAIDGPIYRVGHPGRGLRRHGARHRRGAAGSARRHGRRHLRRHHGPGRHVQRHPHRAGVPASSSCSGCTSCSSSRIAWCSTAAPTSIASCCANCASSSK